MVSEWSLQVWVSSGTAQYTLCRSDATEASRIFCARRSTIPVPPCCFVVAVSVDGAGEWVVSRCWLLTQCRQVLPVCSAALHREVRAFLGGCSVLQLQCLHVCVITTRTETQALRMHSVRLCAAPRRRVPVGLYTISTFLDVDCLVRVANINTRQHVLPFSHAVAIAKCARIVGNVFDERTRYGDIFSLEGR